MKEHHIFFPLSVYVLLNGAHFLKSTEGRCHNGIKQRIIKGNLKKEKEKWKSYSKAKSQQMWNVLLFSK